MKVYLNIYDAIEDIQDKELKEEILYQLHNLLRETKEEKEEYYENIIYELKEEIHELYEEIRDSYDYDDD